MFHIAVVLFTQFLFTISEKFSSSIKRYFLFQTLPWHLSSYILFLYRNHSHLPSLPSMQTTLPYLLWSYHTHSVCTNQTYNFIINMEVILILNSLQIHLTMIFAPLFFWHVVASIFLTILLTSLLIIWTLPLPKQIFLTPY